MMIEAEDQTNLKYLLCRLDFNEYYLCKQQDEEEDSQDHDLDDL